MNNDEPEITTEQVENKLPNPTGKGGFADHPESINRTGRPKNEVSIMYWAKEFLKEKEKGHDKERAQELGEKIVTMAYADGNVVLIKELLDRVEGKTPLKIEGNIGDGLLAVASKLDEIINNGEVKEDDGRKNPTNGETDISDTDLS